MGKTIKEQIADALAPVKAELEDREARVAVLEDTLAGTEEALAGTEEALAGAKARIAELEADRVKMMDLIQEQQAINDEMSCEVETQAARIRDLTAELAALRAAEAEPVGIPDVEELDMSATLYRDALADFAIRVLSGGVAVSFHEARP